MFKSWAVTKGSVARYRGQRLAVEVEDHPLDYGDFEGTIPRASMAAARCSSGIAAMGSLWATGRRKSSFAAASWTSSSKAKDSTAAGCCTRLRDDREHGKRTNWLLIKRHDGYEKDDGADALLTEDRSVASGRSMAAIECRQGPQTEALHAGEIIRCGRRLAVESR